VKKAILVLAVATAALAVGATQLLATTKAADIIVGDGTRPCNHTDFDNPNGINQAITAASTGQTIKVCNGSYNAVNVTKSVTVNGTSLLTTSAQCVAQTTNPANDLTKYSVIDGGVTIAPGVDNVKISQFTIKNGSGPTGAGVSMNGSSDGVIVTKNVIQSNVMGVYLNGGTSGNRNKVNNNCIRSNNDNGAANGNGVYSDQGLHSAEITGNTFYNNNHGGDGGGINLPAGTIDSVLIGTNIANGNANFVSVTGSTKLLITGNTSTHSFGGAVFLDGDNDKTQITGNTFSSGDDDGIGLGDPANTQVLIYGNTISGNASYGIDTNGDSLTGSLISKNTIKSNVAGGIALLNSGNTGNFVTNNKVTSNGLSNADNCKEQPGADNTFYSNNVECAP
jgi:Right handed beta helix region